MSVQFRNYTSEKGFSRDFLDVREFLIRINSRKMISTDYTWDRWEWVFSLPYMDQNKLSTMGIWEDKGEIVALTAYEENPGDAYFLVDPAYMHLKKEMLLYAEDKMSEKGVIRALIHNCDVPFQKLAQDSGYYATEDKEGNSVLDITPERVKYTLPEGYSITSLAETRDIYKYNKVLWNGFNHEGEPPETEIQIQNRRISLSGPHNNLELKIAVVAPDGDFAAYCGMWYEPGSEYAMVEPVATDPAYRLKGCGRAAVLEGIRRCAELGAKRAYVGSTQQFYYKIGFRPLPEYTFWQKKVH